MCKTDMKIRSIVFDLDGVLWDSSQAHEFAYKQVCNIYGLDMPEYHSIAGQRTNNVFGNLIKSKNLNFSEADSLIKKLTLEKRKISKDILLKDPPISNHIEELLEYLSSKYKIALATSSSKANMEVFLTHNNIARFFSTHICGEEVNEAKPSPEIYIKTFQSLGFSPDNVAIVEDSFSGLQAAINSKAGYIVAIDQNIDKYDHVKEINHVCQSVTELLEMF
jgi:beta-phosphoglucomutase